MSHNKKNEREHQEFEFCDVCRLNHNQGRRHVYFPKHKTSLSTLLSRFKSKLSDVKFYLKTPLPLRPDHAHLNRIWCVFCNCDILELDSRFACGNAIEHLASGEHLKRVKGFMWKHGGGMDQVDWFLIAEADFTKWQKRCKVLKIEDDKAEPVGPLVGPLNDIHNELSADCVTSFHKTNVNLLDHNTTNSVLPLQSYTNERAQVSCSALSSGSEEGFPWHSASLHTQLTNTKCLSTSTGCRGNYYIKSLSGECSSHGYNDDGSVVGIRVANGENGSLGSRKLSHIPSTTKEAIQGNVHTGAPPPWFDAAEGNQLDIKPAPSKAGKSSKLNPKRVGAAWAERRKVELELERRGELVSNEFDNNWLPNFGRVWQSGTRKESRREFQTENTSSLKVDDQSEKLMPLQPYVSKRRRTDAGE